MGRWIRAHLTYANLMATIAVFIAVGGGTAVALNGSNTVQSDDIGPGAQVKAPDIGGGAVDSAAVKNFSLGNGDLATGSVNSRVATNEGFTADDIRNGTLKGADIANQSGVDTCTHGTVRFGELCVGVANEHHNWSEALTLCADQELRIPSLGEALQLARIYNVPNVDDTEFFWTEQATNVGGEAVAYAVSDGGAASARAYSTTQETVCVTTPTN